MSILQKNATDRRGDVTAKEEKMSKKAAIALQFCKYCLNWEEAVFGRSAGDHAFIYPSGKWRCQPSRLDYTDLRRVMKCAAQFCAANSLHLKIEYLHLAGKWTVWAGYGNACRKSLCETLMVACLSAKKGV